MDGGRKWECLGNERDTGRKPIARSVKFYNLILNRKAIKKRFHRCVSVAAEDPRPELIRFDGVPHLWSLSHWVHPAEIRGRKAEGFGRGVVPLVSEPQQSLSGLVYLWIIECVP